MNSRKKALLIVVAAALLITCCITITVLLIPRERPLKDPMAHYRIVTEQLSSQEVQASQIDILTKIRIGEQIFSEKTSLSVLYKYKDDQLLYTVAERSVDMGGFHFSTQERLIENTLYIDLAGNCFFGTLDGVTIANQYPPTLLLTAEKYTQISGLDRGDQITIDFQQSVAAEDWALPKNAVLLSAFGSLTTDETGALLESTYTVTYNAEQAQITQTFTAVPRHPGSDIAETFDPSGYTQLTQVHAPVLLERMSGYLLQAQNIGSSYQEYIYCQTFGDQRTRDMQLTVSNEEAFTATLNTTATLVNSSRGEESTSLQQTEIFENGTYCRASNGSEPTPDPTITQEQFQTHCRDILVGTILLPQFVKDVALREEENSITLLFTPKEELAILLCEEAGQSLYQDPTVISAMASSAVTQTLSAYLQIDKVTGLPLSSGIHYKGIYTITELPYRLEYTTDQSYNFSAN